MKFSLVIIINNNNRHKKYDYMRENNALGPMRT